MDKKILLHNEYEKFGINTFTFSDMNQTINKICNNELKKCDYDDADINNIMSCIKTNLQNIPRVIRDKMIINDIVILNDYPLFYNNMGDALCIFMIRYFTPYVWEHKIYIISCDGDFIQSDEQIFLTMYYGDELLSL